MDVREFLRFIHKVSGLGIVIAPNVRGRVTASMNDVTWGQALDSVLKANGLVAVREGDILRIMTIEDARRERTYPEY